MARARKQAVIDPFPAEEENQDFLTPEQSIALAEQEQPRRGRPPAGEISKAAAVREAMAEGLDDLDAIAAYVKDKHGIEIAKPQISAYRSMAKKKESGEPTRRRSTQPTTIPTGLGADLKAIKVLAEEMGGAEKLIDHIHAIVALHQKYGHELPGLVEAVG